MDKFTLSPATLEDIPGIVALYREVAALKGGLARTADEVSEKYVENFLRKSLANGVIIIARDAESGKIIGEIHGYASELQVFAHVLGELTIVVHSEYQGLGIGKAIFTELIKTVEQNRPDILRIELVARESNGKAIGLYQKLGFEIEGRMINRIRSANGGFEADIPMAWHRKTND